MESFPVVESEWEFQERILIGPGDRDGARGAFQRAKVSFRSHGCKQLQSWCAKYVRLTGSIKEILQEDEKHGRISLPPKFGDTQHQGATLIERWSEFGIPILVLLGMGMGEIATDNNNLWVVFRRTIMLINRDSFSLEINDAVEKMGRIGQAITLHVDNYVRRLGHGTDLRNVEPILAKLATTQIMRNVGPAFQSRTDVIKEKRCTGTLGELVGMEGAPRRTFDVSDTPLYQLRRRQWIEIFNHAMRAGPYNGPMHTFESLVLCMNQAHEMLIQIAQCIRVYNYDRPKENKLTVHQLVKDVIRLFSQSTSAVAFRVPARAVAINTILGFSALFDILGGHIVNRERFMESQRAWGGPNAEHQTKISPIWEDFALLNRNAIEWYGMGENFYNISFNVLGVENGVARDIAQKDANLVKLESRNRRRKSSSYHAKGPKPEPKERRKPPEPKARPQPQAEEPPKPKKPAHSNLNLPNPPPPVMFSEDSTSADPMKTKDWPLQQMTGHIQMSLLQEER